MKIKIVISGRLKDKKIDNLINDVNENLKDLGSKIVLNMPLTTLSLTVSKKEWLAKKEETLATIKTEYEKGFSDISFKIIESK